MWLRIAGIPDSVMVGIFLAWIKKPRTIVGHPGAEGEPAWRRVAETCAVRHEIVIYRIAVCIRIVNLYLKLRRIERSTIAGIRHTIIVIVAVAGVSETIAV